MIAYRPPVVRPRARLAQASPSPVGFVVTDMRGRPVGDVLVQVTLPSGDVAGRTDSSGKVTLNVGTGPYNFMVGAGNYYYADFVEGNHRGDVFIALPVCLAQPVLTVPEIGALAAAVLITAAGYHWKFEPAKVTGEVLLGATVFTAIYRLSCL